MSASRRASPAREVRKVYPEAVAVKQIASGMWFVFPDNNTAFQRAISRGCLTRAHAWRNASCRIDIEGKGGNV